jgi:hypothetical protein
MRVFTFVVGAGLAGLFWGSSVQAAVLGPEAAVAPIGATLTDWASSIQFPQFNPSLGTLLSVEINVSSNLSTTLTVSNTSPDSSSSGTATTELQMTVQDAGNNLAPFFTVYSPSFPYSLGPGGSISSGLLTASNGSDNTYTSAPVLAEFTGLGDASLNASTFTQTLLANTGGNTNSSQVTDASLNGTVTYVYSVPEPASLGLILAGLPLLAARRRRQA